MADVVALDLPPGSTFVDALQRTWDAGDAVLPLDQRLPATAKERLLGALQPGAVVGPDGRRLSRAGGRPTADGDAAVVATSGTTGEPKGVVLTHGAVIAHAQAVHDRLEVDPALDRWLACLPLAHVGGLGVVTRALVTGVGLEVLPAFDPVAVDGAARRRGATLVSLVPTALDRVHADSFRVVVLGGSADGRDRPPNVVRSYGLTETGGGVVYDGRPLDGTEVRSVNGELWLRGPTLFRAYRDGSAPVDPEGWLATRDLGSVAADGTVTVQGRRGDLIVTGGENVWPEPLEAVLGRHPKVAEVAVVGRSDAEWGQRVVAVVVPCRASDPPSLPELRHTAKEALPAFAAPREVVLVDGLPRTALGKVRRDRLGNPG